MGAYEFVNSAADSDHDGLADGDEICQGSSLIKTNSDDDSANDYEEWVATTDPNNSSDFFRIISIDGKTVHFKSSASRYYTLLSCSNLMEGSWSDVPDRIDIQGSGGIDTLSDSTTKTSCFYRVQVKLP